MDPEKTRALYTSWTGRPPDLTASAPGRVNLLGEHIDYCGGTVLPLSLDLGVSAAVGPGPAGRLLVRAADLDAERELALGGLEPRVGPGKAADFSDYVAGVAAGLVGRGCSIPGARLLVHGDLPMRAGLSSSAALEIAVFLALTRFAGTMDYDGGAPQLCREAEHRFAGVRCGIMDQFASWYGRLSGILKLDCATLEYEVIPLEERKVKVLVADSGVPRELGASKYNERTASCEAALNVLARIAREDGRRSPDRLAAAGEDLLAEAERAGVLDKETLMRARHVIFEQKRVEEAVRALKARDLERFGELMYASHESLRDLYEVSCPELDLLVETTRTVKGVLGAKMSGAGFGGAVVALVRRGWEKKAKAAMEEAFRKNFGRTPPVMVVRSGQWYVA